ncbi:MAG: hypothetical protein ABJJ69_17425, partial [Paracoccaceae bacterium]
MTTAVFAISNETLSHIEPSILPCEGVGLGKSAWHTVYNFEVADTHTYIADGIRVHNTSALDAYFADPETFGQIVGLEYDAFNRLVVRTEQDDNTTYIISTNAYDETGTLNTHVVKSWSTPSGTFSYSLEYVRNADGSFSIVPGTQKVDLLGGAIAPGAADVLTPYLLDVIGADSGITQLLGGPILETFIENSLDTGLSFLQLVVGQDEANRFGIESVVTQTWDDFADDLVINVGEGLTSAVSKLIMGEIFGNWSPDGLDEEFAYRFFSDSVNTIAEFGIDAAINDALGRPAVTSSPDFSFDAADVTQFFVTLALDRILPEPETPQGAFGEALGQFVTYGGLTVGLGVAAAPALVIAGLAGVFVANLFDNWFGEYPKATAIITYDSASDSWIISDVETRHDGDAGIAEGLGNAVVEMLAEVSAEIGSQSNNFDELEFEFGYEGEDVVGFNRGHNNAPYRITDKTSASSEIQGILTYGEDALLTDIGSDQQKVARQAFGTFVNAVTQLEVVDGDLKVLHALDLPNLEATTAEMSNEDAYAYIHARMKIASQYQVYIDNRDDVDLLMREAPESPAAQAWWSTLLAAHAAGINDGFDVVGDDRSNVFRAADGNDTIFGLAGSDHIYGYAGNDYIDGGDLGDFLYGDIGDNTIFGGEGRDFISALDGNDLIYGGTSEDEIEAGGGSNEVYGGSGDDNITTSEGMDFIDGGEGADTITGGGGDDSIIGGAGNDTITAGAGNDEIRGGAGEDVITTSGARNTVYGGEGRDTITTGSGDDIIYGGFETLFGLHNDVIFAGDGDNEVFGGAESGEHDHARDKIFSGNGNDYIETGSANDYIDARAGHNTIYSGDGADAVRTEAGNDIIYGGLGDDKIFAGDGDNEIFGGIDVDDQFDGSDTITSGDGEDYIDSGAGDDSVESGAGNDTIYGRFGEDAIDAGVGENTIYGGEGADSIQSGSGNDVVLGGLGDDIIDVGDGNNEIFGGNDIDGLSSGNDSIFSGDGNDYIEAGRGDDFVDAGHGNNQIFGGNVIDDLLSGNDRIYSGSGDDYIETGYGRDVIDAGSGDNTIYSGTGADSVHTEAGNDTIHGGLGDDVIDAGHGNNEIFGGNVVDDLLNGDDTIYSGSGSDFIDVGYGNDFVVSGSGNDTINAGAGDDRLNAGAGADSVSGGDGSDWAIFNSSNEGVFASLLDSEYHSGDAEGDVYTGIENLEGSGEDDILIGDHSSNQIVANGGDDILTGNLGDDHIYGGDGNDRIWGESDDENLSGGNDTIHGGSGKDTLFGGEGDDLLAGDDGDDVLQGGFGVDSFDGGAGFDIVDFSDSESGIHASL